jgi:thiol peroxidase
MAHTATLPQISKKRRIVGNEAPSIKIFTDTTTNIIAGMIAINVQLLMSTKDITDEAFIAMLTNLISSYDDNPKVNIVIIVNSSFDEIDNSKNNFECNNIVIAQDTNGDFAKKYGNSDSGDLLNTMFIVDKEGMLVYACYDIYEESAFENGIKILTETINFKPKGHTHENWMA